MYSLGRYRLFQCPRFSRFLPLLFLLYISLERKAPEDRFRLRPGHGKMFLCAAGDSARAPKADPQVRFQQIDNTAEYLLTFSTMRCIVLYERGYGYDRSSAQTRTAGHLRPVRPAAGGLLRLSDHQGPLRLHRDLGVDPLPDPAPAGGGRKPHRLLRGAQRAAAQVLPRHPGRHWTDRPVFVRVAGDRTCLSSDKGVCRI